MSRLGCVTPSAGRVVIDRKACYLSLLAQAAVWLRELRVSRHFSTFYGSSVQSMDTQLDALPILPVLAGGVSGCVNSAFLGLFSTFYGSSVQSMDTQLGARPRRRTLTIHRGSGQRTIALRPTVVSGLRSNGRGLRDRRSRRTGGSGDPARTSAINPRGKKTSVNRNFVACQHRPGGRFPAQRASRAACRAGMICQDPSIPAIDSAPVLTGDSFFRTARWTPTICRPRL